MDSPPIECRRTGTFTAIGEDGRTYTVYVTTWFTRCYVPGGMWTQVAGRREFTTSTGLGVTRLGPGHYHLDATGVALRSRDPAAP